ncbi:MAG: 50S ribosomal protein L9 [Chitinophagaceae bacterium]|nr:MAG: 50S ribosomal protein L9 [Chitinophagaceae bacterium]
MEIILIKDVEKLGFANDLVNVKTGYARNYLLPNGFAIIANSSNKKQREETLKQLERKEEKMLSKIQEVIDKLKETVIQIGAKVGTTDKIFGSVTTHNLAEAIKKQTGISLDRRKIHIEEEVKTIGSYTAEVNLHSDIKVDLKFEVVAE